MREAFPIKMASTQATEPTGVSDSTVEEEREIPHAVSLPETVNHGRSARLRNIERVVYNTPRTRGRFYIYEVYDRDAADPEWYWVKWFGYREEKHDTAQHRDRLVEDKFGDLCDFVDAFKLWQAEAPDDERTFPMFKATHPVCWLFMVHH